MTDPRPAPQGHDRCPTCGVLSVQGQARAAVRGANIDTTVYDDPHPTPTPEQIAKARDGGALDRRRDEFSELRASVDLVTNLGVVMDHVATELEAEGGPSDNPATETANWSGEGDAEFETNILSACKRLAGVLRAALSDDHAVRAAFREHFPHLCAKTTTERGHHDAS